MVWEAAGATEPAEREEMKNEVPSPCCSAPGGLCPRDAFFLLRGSASCLPLAREASWLLGALYIIRNLTFPSSSVFERGCSRPFGELLPEFKKLSFLSCECSRLYRSAAAVRKPLPFIFKFLLENPAGKLPNMQSCSQIPP